MRVARSPLLAIFISFSALGAPSETELDPPYAGIRHFIREDPAVPYLAHVVEVQLTSAELTLVATAEADRGTTTSAWATAEGVHIAVNGDLFDPYTFHPLGLAYGGGNVWSGTADDALATVLRFDQAMGTNHATIDPPDAITAIGPETTGIVSGRPLLVDGGAVTSVFDDEPLTFPYDRGPRTAVGLTMDERVMILVVVDGWQAESIGMTLEEVGNLAVAHGAFRAVALDSGSSSTLYIRSEGGLVSVPSDGVQRAVANHLGVSFTARPPGEIRGVVFAEMLEGTRIANATVTLDDGVTTLTTGTNGFYSFSGLTPRYTCVTADAPGYHPGTGCATVPSASYIYNSIVLYPDSMFIDGGPEEPDAAQPDARPRPDGSTMGGDGSNALTDAGDLPPPGSSCGACRAGGRGTGTGSLLLGACVLLVIRAMLRRA